MQNAHTALGRYGEEVAARWLGQDGLRVLERNWRCSEGELDIVALDGDTVAVCEVKTRSERGFQQPAEAIGPVKADRLRRLAERWLSERWPVHFELLAEGAVRASSGLRGEVPAQTRPSAARPGPPSSVPLPPGGVRIDLVSVVNRARGAALVEHVRGAV